MPISVEPKVTFNDKEKMKFYITEIRKTLSKYPMATGFSNMETAMTRAKNASAELERWIRCLYAEDE